LTAAAVLLAIAALPALAASAYLLLLVVLSRRDTGPRAGPPRLRFDVIVPAHDEEQNISQTVRALLAIDWPRELFRVVVVADNCSDATAARAAEAGAEVLVRDDQTLRGKGYALQLAFAKSLAGGADAVVVIDADTVVTPDLLRAFAARLERGAQAVQADYAVRNPGASWRTRLMSIAFSAFHQLRSTGRERLGVSCGLRGNGMCFSREVLGKVPHEAFSIVEDVEYGIRLGEAGYRVHHAGEAHVYGEMVAGEKASRSQRRRWEGGRLQLAKLHGPRLLRLGLARRSALLFDLGVDVLMPPLSILALADGAGLAASLALFVLRGPGLPLALFGFCVLVLVAYVLRGWQISGTGARGLRDLLCAPFYVIWKVALAARGDGKSKDWVRTQRESK
jgi:cellulose synthase/poly-beta-1,6-N-acetylglucosamine synthase-like glycosyltransferase